MSALFVFIALSNLDVSSDCISLQAITSSFFSSPSISPTAAEPYAPYCVFPDVSLESYSVYFHA